MKWGRMSFFFRSGFDISIRRYTQSTSDYSLKDARVHKINK